MTIAIQTYTSVASLQADTALTPGQIVQTLGYSQPGIGGNTYEIVTAAGTPDSGSLLALDNSAVMARGLFPGGKVNVSQFGAQAGADSSDAFEDALAFAIEVQVTAADQPYQISRELNASTCRRLLSEGAALHFTSVQDQRGLVFPDSNGLRLHGFTFSTQGTVDQFISGGAGGDIEIRDNTFDHAGCTDVMDSYLGGIYLYQVNNVRIHDNVFMNGWRDKTYNAGNVGGNNLHRTVFINNNSQSDIHISHNDFDNVWSAVYAGNCNNLYLTHNKVANTADTGFFDRCTGGVTRNKFFLNNIFKNIGKSAMKPLDSNNESAWGEDAWVDGNIVDGWGMHIDSGCILSGRNYVTNVGYMQSDIKSKRLKITNNTLIQSSDDGSSMLFQLVNMEDVSLENNTIRTEYDAGEKHYLTMHCKNVNVSNNQFDHKGSIHLAYKHEGDFLFNSNQVTIGDALVMEKKTTGINQRLICNNNQITNINSNPLRVYGLSTLNISSGFSLIFTGNHVKTMINKQDGNSAGNVNMLGVSGTQNNIIDNNLIEFSDTVSTQKMLAGDILHPVYYGDVQGAARMNSGVINYKTGSDRAAAVHSLAQV